MTDVIAIWFTTFALSIIIPVGLIVGYGIRAIAPGLPEFACIAFLGPALFATVLTTVFLLWDRYAVM